jgi:hypothetical protein
MRTRSQDGVLTILKASPYLVQVFARGSSYRLRGDGLSAAMEATITQASPKCRSVRVTVTYHVSFPFATYRREKREKCEPANTLQYD